LSKIVIVVASLHDGRNVGHGLGSWPMT